MYREPWTEEERKFNKKISRRNPKVNIKKKIRLMHSIDEMKNGKIKYKEKKTKTNRSSSGRLAQKGLSGVEMDEKMKKIK